MDRKRLAAVEAYEDWKLDQMAEPETTDVYFLGAHNQVVVLKDVAIEASPDACPRCGKVLQAGDWPWCPHGKARGGWRWVKDGGV